MSEVTRRLECITIQIRGISRGLVYIGRETQPNSHLIDAMMFTATCVGLDTRREIYNSDELGEKLQLSIKEAKARQDMCLLSFKEIESLGDIGSILTDLHRILIEVNGGAHFVAKREF